jgi:exodeoxyribonuclease VIII
MPRHFMIDIETWDTAPTSVIRAIALVGFNLDGTAHEMHLIDSRRTVDTQIKAGRTISNDTVTWWSGRPMNLEMLLCRENEINGPIAGGTPDNLAEFMIKIDLALEAVSAHDADIRVWSRGHFDIAILEHLLAAHGRPIPWRYNQVRDVRTLDEITPPIKSTLSHHPLADCLAQIKQVCRALGMAKAGVAASEAFITK